MHSSLLILIYALMILIIASFSYSINYKKIMKNRKVSLKIYNKTKSFPLIFSLLILLMIIFSLITDQSFYGFILLTATSIISFITIDLYGIDKKKFLGLIILLTILMLYLFVTNFDFVEEIQSIAIGSLYSLGIIYLNFNKKSNPSTKIETNRDLFELLLGLIVIFVIIFEPYRYIFIISLLVLAGYTFNGIIYDYKKGIGEIFHKLERRSNLYGFGSLTLAFGTLFMISFIRIPQYAAFFVLLLFFSDSAATIFGIKFGKTKIPYNHKKSIIGTIAFFLVGCIGYIFIGYIAIPVSLALAIFESLPIRVDDNITISIVSVILYLILISI